MLPVVRAATDLLARPAGWIPVAGVAAAGLGLLMFPLFALPGLELGLAISLACTLVGGWVGAAAADALRKPPRLSVPRLSPPGPTRAATLAVGAASLLLLGAAAIPFLGAVLHAALETRCSPWAQAGFYGLLVVPTAILAASAGVFCRCVFPRRRAAGAALYALLLLASLVWTCAPLIGGPQVFAWNFFLGFFPGPLYDEALPLSSALWWFRLETLLWAALLGGFAAGIFLAPGPSHRRHKSRTVLFLFLVATGIGLLEARAVELGFRSTDASVRASLGGRVQTAHAELIYPREKPPEEVERLRRDLEFRLAQLERFFGAPSPTVHLYLFRSPEEKQRLVGAGHTQFAKPWLQSAYLNDAPFPHPNLKHELAHLAAGPFGAGPFHVTSRLWVVPVMGVVEGVAVAADDPPGELGLHAWAAGMRRQVLLPELGGMFGPTGFWAAAPARAYTAAGSFILWLQQSQGKEKLQRLLAHGEFGRVYGRSLQSLVTEWERMLDGLPLDEGAVNRAFARFREPSLFHRPCAREVAGLLASARAASAAEPIRALRLFQRCADLQPEEVDHLLAEAALLQRLDRNAEAAAALDRAESVVAGHPALEALVALGRADLAWATGDLQGAGASLEQARALRPGPDLERQAEVKRAALADGRIAPAVHAYLESRPEELRLWALERARQAAPDSPVVNYLLGRRLLALGQPGEAAESLQRALAQTLPDPISREAWRLVVAAHYQAGDCAAVRTDLGRIPDLGAALRAEVTEWQGRCDFEGRLFNGALVPRGAFR